MVLDIAVIARDYLVAAGYAVCLTRIDNETTLGNSERGDFANAVGARLFVMVHLNGSSDPSVNYPSIFWGKKRIDLAFSQHMLNALKNLTNESGGTDFVGQFANGALLTANMESTLTESVFLTSNDEGPVLADPETGPVGRSTIAKAITNGIGTYLDSNYIPQP